MLPKFPRIRVGITVLFQSPSETVNRRVFVAKNPNRMASFSTGAMSGDARTGVARRTASQLSPVRLGTLAGSVIVAINRRNKSKKILVFSFLSGRTHSLLIGGCSGHDGFLTYHSSKHGRWNTQKHARREAICPGAMSSQQITHSVILSPSRIL